MLVMILTLLPGITMTAYAADIVSYVYYTQNGNTAIRHTDGSQSTYTTVTGSTTSWSNGWYVVNSNVTVSNRISVTGTVYLILCDGYKLTASAGITVTGNNHLVIYGQDAGTGALQAKGSNGYSGIGGGQSQAGGKLTIHGGNVNASCSSWASGIGGGYGKAGGTTTIYGGTVTVSSAGWAAAIGGSTTQGGTTRGAGGTTLIYGGTVTATSNYQDAAIGGGRYAAGGITKIYGGNVTATSKGGNGTGIGGGQDGAGGTTEIHGGNVTVTGSGAGAGIGGCGSTAGGTTIIDGGTVIATGGASAAGIGSGNASTTQGTLNIASDMVVRAGTSSANLPCLDYPDTRSRYAKIWPHNHSSISYSVSGNTLTGTCSETNCNFVNNQFTLLVNADDAVYDGTPHGGTLATGNLLHGLTEIKEITGLTLADSDITFWQGETKLSGVPVNVGVYTAKLTVNLDGTDYTIFKEYNIKPTVTYDANGGTGAPVDSNSPYMPNATVTVLEPGEMAYSGFAFAGWNTEKNGTGTDYVPGDTFTVSESTILYAQWGYCVTITAGSGMTKTTASGDATQTIVAGAAMTDVVYTANEGYYFPTDYSVTDVNGISVTRDSHTQITVSGTPTANAEITLTAATAKTAQTAPTELTATKASGSTAADGKISGVTDAMEYQKDGDTAWTAVGNDETEITGLTAGTYKVRYAGTADKNASDAATVVVGTKEDQTAPASLTVNKASSDTAADGTISGVTAAMEYQKDGDTAWTAVGNDETEITGLTAGTYKVRYAGTADKNASDAATVVVGTKEDQTAPASLTVNKASSDTAADGTISGVTAAMEYQKDGDTAWTAVGNDETEITGLTAGTYKVRYAGTADKNASDAATVVVGTKEDQTAPAGAGLTATKASSDTAADGKISGVTEAMEYQKDGDTSWTAVGNDETEITGLTAGTYKVRYAGTADKNASPETSVEVGVKAKATVAKAPEAKNLTYTGSAQELVTAGEATGGTMYYAVTTENTAPTDDNLYTTSIPSKTEAGTYYVWYKVVADGDYVDTEPAVVETRIVDIRFISHSLVLSGSIGINFLMNLPTLDGIDYTDSKMVFTVEHGDEEQELVLSDAKKVRRVVEGETKVLYQFTCFVSSVQMADTITATFHYKWADAEGTLRPATVTDTYSVKQYVQEVKEFLEESGPEATKTFTKEVQALVRALADFGFFAQKYLADARGWTIGEDHEAMERYENLAYTDAQLKEARAALASFKIWSVRSSKISKVSFSLHLDSDTSIYLYFTPVSGYKGSVSATVDGKAASVRKLQDGRYKVVIPNIGAHMLGNKYAVVLKTGSSSTSVNVSALSYANSVINTEKGKELGMALYNYYAKAQAVLKKS